MSEFLKLCTHNGEYYAVKCEGEEYRIGKAIYFVSKTLDGKMWCVTLGMNGWSIAKSESKEALVSKLNEIHNAMGPTGLKKATYITEEEYRRMILNGK